MSRIFKLFLSLLVVAAIVSAGFAIFGAVQMAAAQANKTAIQAIPAASASSAASSQSAAAVVVGPQQAGLCALYKLPTGTTIDVVNGAYTDPTTTITYYQVKLHFGNYAYTRYVNSTNCSIIPSINGSCSSGSGCANNELGEIVVSQQLAGLCALHKLPAGTVVDRVRGAYYKIPKPYYRVDLHFGNYSYLRYIDATNCNIIPNPN
ncbi:MAG: hypothetical protein P4L50_28785 [Anaerolineaceae bacterium]|nr:hypothetical protein [Anaerolineaceae bacterium]